MITQKNYPFVDYVFEVITFGHSAFINQEKSLNIDKPTNKKTFGYQCNEQPIVPSLPQPTIIFIPNLFFPLKLFWKKLQRYRLRRME